MEVSGGVFWVGGGWANSFIDKWGGGVFRVNGGIFWVGGNGC